METAGDGIIQDYCSGYESSASSYILPPLYDSEYTEERIPKTCSIPLPSRPLSAAEFDRYMGICSNQTGEMSENRVFTLFHQIMYSKEIETFILLRKLDLDNNSEKGIKKAELIKELPSIDLSRVNMKGEHDFVMIIKNTGIVLIEVKSTIVGNSVRSAEKQLANGTLLMQAIMGGIKKTPNAFVPVAKVIVVPYEQTLSPLSRNDTDQCLYQIHDDQLVNFSTILCKISQILRSSHDAHSFSSAEFDRFTKILIGLWCLTPIRPGPTFTRQFSSTAKLTKYVDEKLDQQIISSYYAKSKGKRKYTSPVTDVQYCDQTEIYRNCEMIKAIFLTPTQKQILDNYPHVLISGGAGSGKTIITLFKCIDIIQSSKEDKILLIVPPPHDQRCQTILRANGIASERIERYPPKDITVSSVFIISLKNFFAVTRDILFAYDLTEMSVFIDDMQAYNTPYNDNVAKYGDIVSFIDQTYETAQKYSRHFWCCIDILQGGELHVDYDENPLGLLYDRSGAPRSFGIPTVYLRKVLRNSREIMTVVDHMRETRKQELVKKKQITPNMAFCDILPGHNITSAPVLYHKLNKGHSAENIKAFLLHMIEKELTLLLVDRPDAFHPSEVAILRDGSYLSDNFIKSINEFLQEKLKISTQTIEESIATGNKEAIVLDERFNTMSYEVPCVVYISTFCTLSYNSLYVLTSRARCRLTIIDLEVNEPPLMTENVTLVTWTEKNGVFMVQ